MTALESVEQIAGPDAWRNRMMPFMAVGRVKDATVLASYGNADLDPEGQTMEIFKKILVGAATKLTAGQRTRLQWNQGSVCCLMDIKGENLYCVVKADLRYPERLAYQMLWDLEASACQMLWDLEASADKLDHGVRQAAENGLQYLLGIWMRNLVGFYEDSKNFPQLAVASL